MRVDAAHLREFISGIFVAAGCSDGEGAQIARYLVAANLVGHDSHGVVRVPRYVDRLKDGSVKAGQQVDIVTETPVLAVVDAKDGFGQTVGPQAVQIGIDKCRSAGLSAVALRNAGHIGRIGDWAEIAAAEGFVSIHFVNAAGSVLVAPYGGVDRRLSTAPFCVGVPRPGEDPLILDFATSLVAEGKVMVASQGGKKLPPDAMIGPDGRVSDDPRMLYGNYDPTGPREMMGGPGAIRAFGDHKGSGLAFMCEILGGALTGNGATKLDRKFANGMLSIYLDPKKLDASEFFPGEVARYVAYYKSAKPMAAGGEVLVPGEVEARNRKERSAAGIPLPDDTWRALLETAERVGADTTRVQAGILSDTEYSKTG